MRWIIIVMLLFGGALWESTPTQPASMRPALLWLACACAAWRGLTPLTVCTAVVAGLFLDGVSAHPFGTGFLTTLLLTLIAALLAEQLQWRSLIAYLFSCSLFVFVARGALVAAEGFRVDPQLIHTVAWKQTLLTTIVQATASGFLALLFFPCFRNVDVDGL